MGELEQKQAFTSSKLWSEGFDERTADHISLKPDLLMYGILDALKNKYVLD